MGVVIGFVMCQRLLNGCSLAVWPARLQRMASGTLSATSYVSASPATMNNLLNLVTDPEQPGHNLIDHLHALQKSAQYQLSTFLSIIRQFHEHN